MGGCCSLANGNCILTLAVVDDFMKDELLVPFRLHLGEKVLGYGIGSIFVRDPIDLNLIPPCIKEWIVVATDMIYIKTQVFKLLRYCSPAPRNIARSDWVAQNITHNMTSSLT